MADAFSSASTLAAIHATARRQLEAAGLSEAALDARLLVEHFTGTDRTAAIVSPDRMIDGAAIAALTAALARRLAGEPVHRIIGRRAFHGVELLLSPATLDPRPDTEALVDLALDELRRMAPAAPRILDLGTGTGAVAIALLAALPSAQAVATDISPGALEIAARNADMNRVSSRFRAVRADWLDGLDGRFHAIVSNPPYIRSNDVEGLEREVRDFDPRAALDGGADGLDAYRRIAAGAASHLDADGFVAVEIGHDQAADVGTLFAGCGMRLERTGRDLAGHARALLFRPA